MEEVGVDGGTRFPRLRLPLRKEQYLCLKMELCRPVVEEVRIWGIVSGE